MCVHVCVIRFWHTIYHTLAILPHTHYTKTHTHTHTLSENGSDGGFEIVDSALSLSNKSEIPTSDDRSNMFADRGNPQTSSLGSVGSSLGGSLLNNRWNSFENLLEHDANDPNLYIVKHDYSTDQAGQLSIKKGDKLKISRKSENGDWAEATNVQGDIGWVPASYIAKVDSLEKHSWFHGNITRAEAELSLSSGINGSFLLRESESKPGQFSISLRYDGRVFHYRIHLDASSKYYVTPESKFENLSELVVHHSKNPDGLTTTLHYPAPNPRKPPIYSLSHEVDEWELNRSDIDMGQKLGGGQYGEVYKATIKKRNISVAVKTFRVSLSLSLSLSMSVCICMYVCM